LGKEDATAAAQIAGAAGQYTQRGQMPPPEIVQSLSLAEEAAAQRRENERQAAITAAEAAGQVPETRITEKGVTKIYKPSTSTSAFMPEEITLPSGVKLIRVGPRQFRFAPKTGAQQDLTPSNLLVFSEQLDRFGDANDAQTAAKIRAWLSNKAVGQMGTSTQPPTTTAAPIPNAVPAPNAPATGKIRVKRISDGKPGTINAEDFDAALYERIP